jgi:hypothetical protein
LAGGFFVALPAAAAVPQQFPKSPVTATLRGTVNLAQLATQTPPPQSGQPGASEFRRHELPKNRAAPPTPSGKLPSPPNTPIVSGQLSGFVGFDGLNHRDQRLANNGNQFSLEPPDEGLCTDGSVVMEGVNLAEQVYTALGLLCWPSRWQKTSSSCFRPR